VTVVYFFFPLLRHLRKKALLLDGSKLSPVSHSGTDEGKYAVLVEWHCQSKNTKT